MGPITVASVLARAAFFLNDTDRSNFTDARLLEPFNVALDDLREELQDFGISFANKTSGAITVTAGQTEIGGANGPSLPNDFLVAINLYERTADTSQDYLIMQKVDFLPKTNTQTTFLIYWTYQHQIIKLLGATSDVQVKIDYVANTLVDAVDGTSTVNLRNAMSFLSYRTAALAAEYIGENPERAISLNGNAFKSLEQLLNLDIKQKQNQVTRKRPFMASYKSRGYF